MSTAIERLRDSVATGGGLKPLRVMAASGQLGYGIPGPAFETGLVRKPHLIGADMGSRCGRGRGGSCSGLATRKRRWTW